ncbi:MAG: CoA-binding protein [Candidatus Abyssobacteria bacterium SURF_17]|uniref:CoA-binding protein n=1 Tax=Candidatus Abyssobacteria bacterium SURF_17 TaxID=2093361 RepID=A0A419EN14_9BACT|nr:MAG: CoA-binding protein [Candidatus Abyssubacteria bacterium SURF_17]
MTEKAGLGKLFSPKSVAVVGASREKGKVGHTVLRNLINHGFSGKIYPVNPQAKSILGKKCFPSLLEIPGEVDLAVFAIPAEAVVATFEQCGGKNIPASIIISAGFKESGRKGASLEAKLAQKAAEDNIRVLGPNCLGVIDTSSSVNATFAAGMPPKGNIGFFSQSGALCTAILDWAIGEGIGFSKFVSLGNKLDIDETDMLRAMGEDEHTEVILGYLEGVKDGVRFLEAAGSVTQRKPVIMLKSGGTEAGARAASSHTGSLAGSEKAFAAAFTQSGIIRAVAIEDLFEYARAFSSRRYPKGNRVAIVTNAGGPAIIASDAVERSSLRMASFEKETIESLRTSLPPSANVYNPVDLIGDAKHDRYAAALEAVLKDPNVDGVFVIFTPQAMSGPEEVARAVARCGSNGKPILPVFMGGPAVEGSAEILSKASMPNYRYPEPAISAMEAMVRYETWRARPAPEYKSFSVDKKQVQRLLEEAWASGQTEIGEYTAREIISAYGFKVPGSVIANNVSDAEFIAEKIGFPVVLKIASPDILHKSDFGGVRVGVRSREEVREVFHEMKERVKRLLPDADLWGISVQEMIQGGKEVIIGMVRDPQFGPVVMFGLGGIYVEIMKDVAFRIAPLSIDNAQEMVREIKSFPLLQGARGEKPVHIEAIVEALLRFSQLVTDFPEIYEMDINPLKVFPQGREPVALDARLALKRNEVSQ